MRVNTANVTYSSIVAVGEKVQNREKESGNTYLKLHRGVMDVCSLDLNTLMCDFDFNEKKLQQYGGNDGDVELISSIKNIFGLNDHSIIVTPGGMAALDILINSIEDEDFWISKYHWGSWNKILKTHNKVINTFDDFKIKDFTPNDGVVMLCYPSNPTGWMPDFGTLTEFIKRCDSNDVTVILDIPYYHLFYGFGSDLEINELFMDNVIVVSSFSKSLGLSGFRVGYVATKNSDLHNTLRIRSLYKYNSISTISQKIVLKLISTPVGLDIVESYRIKTLSHIKKNVEYLIKNNLLFDEYPSNPVGPFAIVKISHDKLMNSMISSVPLSSFCLDKDLDLSDYSRISVAVDNGIFEQYFNKMMGK